MEQTIVNPKLVEACAEAAHEVNRAYCLSLGDESQVHWADAPDWQKDSVRAGAKMHLTGVHGPEESHAAWLEQKAREGWKYGPVKDVEKKEHPCFLPYNELPPKQRLKDELFIAVVQAASRVWSAAAEA